jgi:hypothetical protein
MTSRNAHANAKLLFKALAASEPNLKEPIPDDRIMDVALQIGLEDAECDLALDYAADQGWFEDAEVEDDASWVSLTPAGLTAAKSWSCWQSILNGDGVAARSDGFHRLQL